MAGQEKVPYHFRRHWLGGRELLEDFPDCEEIPQRLGHLLLIDLHEPVVDPVPGELLAGRRAGLGDFVLVVWKDEILATPVDVERVAEVLHRHG